MQEQLERLRALGGDAVVITFVEPARLKQYLSARPWPFRVLADPDRALYRAFGLESASWFRLLRPRVLGAYVGLLLRGRIPQPAREDVHQLGGDFVLDPEGRLVYAHRSTDPADRPDVSDLLGAVARASPCGSGGIAT